MLVLEQQGLLVTFYNFWFQGPGILFSQFFPIFSGKNWQTWFEFINLNFSAVMSKVSSPTFFLFKLTFVLMVRILSELIFSQFEIKRLSSGLQKCASCKKAIDDLMIGTTTVSMGIEGSVYVFFAMKFVGVFHQVWQCGVTWPALTRPRLKSFLREALVIWCLDTRVSAMQTRYFLLFTHISLLFNNSVLNSSRYMFLSN